VRDAISKLRERHDSSGGASAVDSAGVDSSATLGEAAAATAALPPPPIAPRSSAPNGRRAAAAARTAADRLAAAAVAVVGAIRDGSWHAVSRKRSSSRCALCSRLWRSRLDSPRVVPRVLSAAPIEIVFRSSTRPSFAATNVKF
jgi:hypothetical protein